MVLRLGTLNHAKGFIINKLWEQRRIGGKHLSASLLPHGYPLRHRHLIREALQELGREGVVLIGTKRTGRGSEDHVSLSSSKLAQIRGLMNAYRESVKLPKIGRDFETLLYKGKPRENHPEK